MVANWPVKNGLSVALSSGGSPPVSRSGAAICVQLVPRLVERERMLQPRYIVDGVVGSSTSGAVGSGTGGASVGQRRPLPREPNERFCDPTTPVLTTVAPAACANASA